MNQGAPMRAAVREAIRIRCSCTADAGIECQGWQNGFGVLCLFFCFCLMKGKTTMDPNRVREELAALNAQAQTIIDLSSAEKRDLTAEEDAKVDEIYTAFDAKKGALDKYEADQGRRARAETNAAYLAESAGRRTSAGQPNVPDPSAPGNVVDPITMEIDGHSMAFEAGTPEHRRASPEYAKAFASYLVGGMQAVPSGALQADADVQGGYLVAPMQLIADLIKKLDDSVFMRGLATVLPPLLNAEAVGVPSLDADPADADWTTELQTGNEDSTMALGRREMHPHPLAKRIKVSNKLLRLVGNAEQLVTSRLVYKFGITEEKGFQTGSGSKEPLGVFTASADGITTGRDVVGNNTATTIKADALIDAQYSLKEGYMSRATWLFHRDAVKQIRKLKDGNSQYIWSPGLASGQPSTILDRPFVMSEYTPNTFTAGLYVGMIADFSYYWIIDSLMMTIQRLVELYAETNQVGLIGRKSTDGAPVLEEAFARVTLGT